MRKFALYFFFIGAGPYSVSAQPVSVGVKGGITFTDATGRGDQSRGYIVGPAVEVRLPAGFALELDALYQHIGNDSAFGNISIRTGENMMLTSYATRSRGDSWTFPLLGKYYFGSRSAKFQPFAGLGPAIRTIGFNDVVTTTSTDGNGVNRTDRFSGNSRPDPDIGAVIAGGMRFHLYRLAVLPEFRYTRWGSSTSFLHKNEVNFLLGIQF